MAVWGRTITATKCGNSRCERPIAAGDPVCLITTAKYVHCEDCAFYKFGYQPDAPVDALPRVMIVSGRAMSSSPAPDLDRIRAARFATAKELVDDFKKAQGNDG